MKLLRACALATFVVGVSVLGIALVRGGGGTMPATPEPSPTYAPVEMEPIPRRATPTPTPKPFDGAVISLRLPRFGVDSKIENIGLLPDNQLDVPRDPHATGWYDIYDKPGFGGNAVFAAHVDYVPNIKGPFNKLATMVEGDSVVVVMENGLEYTYRVLSNTRYEVATIPMGEIIWPKNRAPGKEWVTLITCGGEFVPGSNGEEGHYLHRDVVVAERVQ